VGDYCTFGAFEGVVERIGVRSTQVRALDRTLITIPNSQFADMELVNWAMCDQMMIYATIGIRYETDSDQFRFVLAEIRRTMHAHPRIDNDTVRVRFDGFGDSSLNIQVRVYAKTREWNDFYAIREDVMFRIKQIVEASGSSFAFPSQTLYMSQDDGLDTDKSAEAIRTVAKWRRQRELPFPGFSAAAREKIDDRLDYPPKGSPDYKSDEVEVTKSEETLSIAPEPLVPPEPPETPETEAAKDDAGSKPKT
ncbi:MAG: mechanosensitive ion channel family protein, partial [Roseobacter sp.]